MLLVIPMLAVVQIVSASVGAVSKKGLEDCVGLLYGRPWALVMLFSVLAVNVITLAADLEGGSAALGLLSGINYRWFVVPFAAAVAALLVYGRYTQVSKVLQYVALVFFAYAVAAVMAKPDWAAVLHASLVPTFKATPDYISGVVALLGTTLTSYAYVWETIEVSEERPPLARLGLVQADAALGIVFAGISFWFIVVATGATLGVHHHAVQTAEDAAAALRPFAGRYAALLFGVGLLASAVIAVPVLAGTSAYVMAEAFGWRASLDANFAGAPEFYRALLLSLVAGTFVALLGVKPISLLFFASIAGAFGTPITLTLMLLVARNRKVMHRRRISTPVAILGWTVNAIVGLSCAVYLVQTLRGG